MSRTSMHRPYWVWHFDARICVEVHDHRNGPCDLVPADVWADELRVGVDHRDRACGWDVDMARLPNTCGCGMCTEAVWRRAERRRSRHRSRLELRRGDWLDELT
jgi:hypothetical protein